MKNLQDLFQLVATATEQNGEELRTWFINYSGHVNKMQVNYYFTGWKKDSHSSQCDSLEQNLDEDGIQSLYWFIKTRLK
ncbi:MAG: hypothetical protein ABF250_08275 [Polaribacter sp.]|uniref:hypothetical protein n=1 Tax=Polaribacter sp. TaxID=1920175 RepID=UPI00321A72DA